MDLIGWFLLGVVGAAFLASWWWGRRTDQRRAAGARAWASSVGMTELGFGQEGISGDTKVHRLRSIPSFVGTLDGRKVSVIATSTRARFGDLWVFCTHAPRPPLFLGSLVGFAGAHALGIAPPQGWARVKAGELDRHFLASVAEAGTQPVLSEDARAALLEANVHAWCFNVNPSGFTVLWFKQSYGQDTQEALTQGARLLGRLLA